jgi:solute:Na+ symporter, SSS family
VTVIGAIIAIFMTLAIDSIKGLNLFDVFQSVLGFIAPPMSAVFLFGVLWKKTTSRAANIILTGGTAFSLGTGVLYLWVFPSREYDFWPHFLLLSFFIFVILSAVAFFVSLLDRNAVHKDQNTLDFGKMVKTTPKVRVLWLMLIIVMIGLYVFFNGH